MAQPTYSDLLGAGATINQTADRLEIPLTALAAAGLDAENPTATNVLGAIVKNAHSWLETNEDEEVMVASTLSIFAPVQRNEQDRTEFGYTLNFYGNYETPDFDPDEV